MSVEVKVRKSFIPTIFHFMTTYIKSICSPLIEQLILTYSLFKYYLNHTLSYIDGGLLHDLVHIELLIVLRLDHLNHHVVESVVK